MILYYGCCARRGRSRASRTNVGEDRSRYMRTQPRDLGTRPMGSTAGDAANIRRGARAAEFRKQPTKGSLWNPRVHVCETSPTRPQAANGLRLAAQWRRDAMTPTSTGFSGSASRVLDRAVGVQGRITHDGG